MNLSLILFTIGILGFVLNRKNIILMLISIEIMLLAITFLILVSSLSFDDILGQTYAIYIISIAGAESAIGLGILVAFYRFNLFLILSHGLFKGYSESENGVVQNHRSFLNPALIYNKFRENRRFYSTLASAQPNTKNSELDP